MTKGLRPVRYTDDFVVSLRKRRHAADALKTATTVISGLGLTIAQHKTHLTSFEADFMLGTLFVGSLAMPRHRVEDEKCRAYYSAGYEAPRVRCIPRRTDDSVRAFLV